MEIALLLGLFAILLVPLSKVTGQRSQQVEAPGQTEAQEEALTSCFLTLDSAHPLKRFELLQGTKILWRSDSEELNQEADLPPFDLTQEVEFRAQWQENLTQTALRLSFEPDGLDTEVFHFWGEGEQSETILLNPHE